jgi:crotonobetainyl-CoA:carnitine CoA-transferase CaiB-like acyl-CoA transferase
LELAGGERTKVLASPYCFDGARRTDTRLPPALGEDTVMVLRDLLGYDKGRIGDLAEAGAFGAGTIIR